MNIPYVNEWLRRVDQAYSAQYTPASDPAVDDQIDIYLAGAKTRWSIQIASGYFAINEIGFKDGEVDWLQDHGMFPSLERAVVALCDILKQKSA